MRKKQSHSALSPISAKNLARNTQQIKANRIDQWPMQVKQHRLKRQSSAKKALFGGGILVVGGKKLALVAGMGMAAMTTPMLLASSVAFAAGSSMFMSTQKRKHCSKVV